MYDTGEDTIAAISTAPSPSGIGIIRISGDSIAPMMGERRFDNYMVTALKGTITADSLIFSNNYGTYQDCSYVGKVTKMEVRK